jgi:hypothetical protein
MLIIFCLLLTRLSAVLHFFLFLLLFSPSLDVFLLPFHLLPARLFLFGNNFHYIATCNFFFTLIDMWSGSVSKVTRLAHSLRIGAHPVASATRSDRVE